MTEKINLLKMQSKEQTAHKYAENGTAELKDISANANADHAG